MRFKNLSKNHMYFICYSISAPAGDFILVQFKCVHIDFSKFFILALFNITYYNSVVSVKLFFFHLFEEQCKVYHPQANKTMLKFPL